MKSTKGRVALTVVILLPICTPGLARDVINLSNGKILSGQIIGETETEVRLLIDDIEIPIAKRNIESIVRDGVLDTVDREGTQEPAPGVQNPTPLYRKEPTPTPEDTGIPGIEATQETSVEQEEYPYPGREPLVPLLLPLGRFRVVSGSVVNLRAGPGTNHRRVAALPRGTLLLELSQEDFWVHVITEAGEEGWISAEYTEPSDAVVAISTGHKLNIRSGPSLQQAPIGQLNRGDLVILIEEINGWGHVRDLEGKYGWVSTNFLQTLSDLRTVRPAIAEMGTTAAQTFLGEDFSTSWSGEEESEWKQLVLTVGNDALVRNGVAVLLLLWDMAPPEPVETQAIVRSSDMIWKEKFSTRAEFEDLGFSLALRDTTNTAIVVYLRGEKSDGGWTFQAEVLQAAVEGCRMGLVVQQGLQRGAVAVFEP